MLTKQQIIDFERARRQPACLYHLTPLTNIRNIKRQGIKANEAGEIFVYSHPLVADTIAANQVFTREYGVFEVNRAGIADAEMERDICCELAHPWQWIIKQEVIGPDYLVFVGRYKVSVSKPDPFYWLYYTQCLGWSEETYLRLFRWQQAARRKMRTGNPRRPHRGSAVREELKGGL